MDAATILLWLIAFCLSIIVLMIFAKPLKTFIKMIYQGIIAVLSIFVLNFLFSPLGLSIGINFLTIIFVTILGMPGVIALYFMQIIL